MTWESSFPETVKAFSLSGVPREDGGVGWTTLPFFALRLQVTSPLTPVSSSFSSPSPLVVLKWRHRSSFSPDVESRSNCGTPTTLARHRFQVNRESQCCFVFGCSRILDTLIGTGTTHTKQNCKGSVCLCVCAGELIRVNRALIRFEDRHCSS